MVPKYLLPKNKNFYKFLLQVHNVLHVVIIKSAKHDLLDVKTESWVAVEVTNSFP